MTRTTWKLDAVPLCWETPDTLRLGFDEVAVRLGPLSAAARRTIELLCVGVSNAADPVAAVAEAIRMAGSRDADASSLAAVLPQYVTSSAQSQTGKMTGVPALRTFIADNGRNVTGLAHALDACGAFAFTRITSRPDFVLRVIRYLEPLEWTQRWLMNGVPHLLIRYTDVGVRIGPLVSSEGAPCHTCEALQIVDEDPLAPRLAAQLVQQVPASETPTMTRLAIAHAMPFVQAWRQGHAWVRHQQLVIPLSRGDHPASTSRIGASHWETIVPHAECGCTLAAQQAA